MVSANGVVNSAIVYRRVILSCLALFFGACSTANDDTSYDVIFLNGLLVDGTGNAAYKADVAVVDRSIAAIGDLSDAKTNERIDINGLVLAPGFIDVHSHSDEALLDPELKSNKGFITQGVTTSVYGVDGAYSTSTIDAIRKTFEKQGVGTNYLFYVGHNGIRRETIGLADRPPNAAELEAMQMSVRAAMQQGAIGLSSGLMYLPGRYASTEELIALATVVAEFDGLYDSHIRDPAGDLLASIDECLVIADAAGIAAHPAHLKAVGGKNFGMASEIVDLIESAQADNVTVTADLYPYDGAAARNLVDILIIPANWSEAEQFAELSDPELPPAKRKQLELRRGDFWRIALADRELRQAARHAVESPADGVFSWIDAVGYGSFRIVVADDPNVEGKMVSDLAATAGKEPFDLIADLIVAEGRRPKVTLGAIQEHEVRELMRQPWVMISSDGREAGTVMRSGHPRFRGSFPRVLGRYVREWNVLTLEDAVRKMTSLPAHYLRLPNRGVIKEGFVADITVFDPVTIIDRATWEKPWRYSDGVVHVVVNGKFALKNSAMTGAVNGEFIHYKP